MSLGHSLFREMIPGHVRAEAGGRWRFPGTRTMSWPGLACCGVEVP